MAAQKNTVNSGKAKSSAKRGLQFSREDLIELHWVQGLSLTEIGKRYGVTAQAIKYWTDKWEVEHRAKLQEVLFEASPALSYVIGVLVSDGCVYYNAANNHHHLFLSVVDRPFSDAFAKALSLLGIRSTIRVEQKGCENCQPKWRVWACSKQFYNFWNEMTETQRLDLGIVYPADFIRGIYDGEGTLKSHRGTLELTIYNTNRAILERIEWAMLQRNLTPKWFEKKSEIYRTCWYLSLYRSLEIKRFFAWIMPTIKYHPRGYANPEPIQDGDILAGVETTKGN